MLDVLCKYCFFILLWAAHSAMGSFSLWTVYGPAPQYSSYLIAMFNSCGLLYANIVVAMRIWMNLLYKYYKETPY